MSKPLSSQSKARLFQYTVGYVLSLILSITTYVLVNDHVQSAHQRFSHQALTSAIMIFALMQVFVQLIFFLHLGDERKPRWNLIVFSFMAGVVVILVGGTLWIMKNLDYAHDHRSPDEINTFIFKDEGVHE